MTEKLVYLAGPITGISFTEANDWREEIQSGWLPASITCLSPLRGKRHLEGSGIQSAFGDDSNPLSTCAGIVARDRFDCQRSDLVLLNLRGATQISIGTCVEIGWADAARRPMIAVMEPGNVHDHAFIRAAVPFIVGSLDEAVALIRAILLP